MNIALKAGQNKAWLITVTDSAGAYDLTSCTIDVWAFDAEDVAAGTWTSGTPTEIAIDLTGDKNTALWKLVPANTTGRGDTQLTYAVRLTSAASEKFPIGEGRIDVEPWPFDV